MSEGTALPYPVKERVPQWEPRADASAYAVAHAYQQLLVGLREGTSYVPDVAHGAARHRSIESAVTAG